MEGFQGLPGGQSELTTAEIGQGSRRQPAAISEHVGETHLLYLDCSQTSELKGLSRKMIFHLSEILLIHYAESFRSRRTSDDLKADPRPPPVDQWRRTRRVTFPTGGSQNLAASSSGSDKKRSHFPLKINKAAAHSEHAHWSSQRTEGSVLQLFQCNQSPISTDKKLLNQAS